MKIIDWFRRIRLRKRLLIPSSNPDYEDSIKQVKEKIINSMQGKEFSKIEEAYYAYIELGKILSEDPINAFGEVEERRDLFNKNRKRTSRKLQGYSRIICKYIRRYRNKFRFNKSKWKSRGTCGCSVKYWWEILYY